MAAEHFFEPIVLADPMSPAELTGQCDCDCDCDSLNSSRLPEQPLSKSWMYEHYRLAGFQMLPMEEEYSVILGPSRLAVVNQQASQMMWGFSHPARPVDVVDAWDTPGSSPKALLACEKLVNLGFLTPSAPTSCLTPQKFDTLATWLQITDRCNLRCSYCYMPKRPRDMSLEVGRRILDSTFASARKHKFQRVKVKYAGGESLLGLPTILALQRYGRALQSEYNLELEGVVLSNGTLLSDQSIRSIKEARLSLMLSLDEIEAGERKFANGSSASQAIQSGILLALEHQLVPHISVTVTNANAPHLPRLISWLLDYQLPFSLNFYREDSRSNLEKLDPERIIPAVLKVGEIILTRAPQRSLLKTLADRADLSAMHEYTCGVGLNYLVFDTQGNLSKCQMAMEDTIPGWENDPVLAIRSALNGPKNTAASNRSGCEGCEWRFWCSGGCPMLTDYQAGKSLPRLPFCEIYKALLPGLVALEGRRILKRLL